MTYNDICGTCGNKYGHHVEAGGVVVCDFTAPKIQAGAPCTYCIGADRYAGKVLHFSKGFRSITVELNHGTVETFTLRKDGTWRSQGMRCGFLHVGSAEDYRDPSF